jgi:hypothetical protein
MRTPRQPNSDFWIDASLFSPEEIFGLSKKVNPSLEYARAQAMAWDLHGTFINALDFEYPQTNSSAHKRFYTSLANDIRRLIKKLGLPDDPFEIGSQFPFGTIIDKTTEGTIKIPDGLSWLLDAGLHATTNSKNFALLIARSLKNPEDPGDWHDINSASSCNVKFEERTETTSDPSEQNNQRLIEIRAAVDAQRAVLEAALAEACISPDSVPTDVRLNTLLDMAEHGTDPMDAIDRSYLRAYEQVAWTGDGTYGLREERRQAFCEAQLFSLPFLLGLALGAIDGRLRQIHVGSKYENWNRRFLRELFQGLVSDHYSFFGRPPQVRDNDNLPEGSGVNWARGILKIAANNINQALREVEPDPYQVRKSAILLVKQASCLAKETIADRLDEAKKWFSGAEFSDPEEGIYLSAILAQRRPSR